jgi:uncharacterized SAM-binding protein YcdF (DUF218 family)
MADIERKEVVLSTVSQTDIKAVFVFGAETFGFIVEKPGVLTTFGRSKWNYHRWLNNKHLIPEKDGQFTPA